MKVNKSTTYKLEVERECGCKIVRDYKDEVCKNPHGDASFSACDKHQETADLIKELLTEVLEREAREAKAAAPVIHPRTAAMLQQPTEDTEAEATTVTAPTARTLRMTGSGAGARRSEGEGHRPAAAPAPRPGSSQHRPGPKTSSGGGFRRSDPNSGLSAAALAKVAAAPKQSVGLEIDMEAVDEDHRVTNVIEELGFLDEPDNE